MVEYTSSTLTINFTSITATAEKFIDLELDDERNGGISSFEFASGIAWFKMFTNCTNVQFFTSAGTVGGSGSDIETVAEYITFTQPPASFGGKVSDNTASLQKPANISFNVLSGSGAGSLSLLADQKTVQASATGPGVYNVEYQAEYTTKNLSNVLMPTGWTADIGDYPVVVIAVGD